MTGAVTASEVTGIEISTFSLSSSMYCLQCFETVGWASGRASGL